MTHTHHGGSRALYYPDAFYDIGLVALSSHTEMFLTFLKTCSCTEETVPNIVGVLFGFDDMRLCGSATFGREATPLFHSYEYLAQATRASGPAPF